MTNTIKTNTDSQTIVPNVIYCSDDIAKQVSVNPIELGSTMRELGISDKSIEESTLYIDPKNRLLNFGTHYPNAIGRMRFWSNPEIQESKGDIVRLSARVRGKRRTGEQINRTLVHELEHVAQADRKDIKVTEGHVAIWGLAAVGALVGSRFGETKTSKLISTGVGAFIGHNIGYLLAPHEVQARKRAGQNRGKKAEITTTSITVSE